MAISTLANNKRSCSKNWKISGQSCVFSVFPAKILARFSCVFLFQHRQKKLFFAPAIYIVLIYTPKEAHSRFFVTGESVFARQMLAKKLFLAWPACRVLLLARRACVLLVLRTQNPNKCSEKKIKISKVAILKCEPCIAHRIWAWGPAPWPIREKTVRFAFFLPSSKKLANLYRYRPPGRPSQLLRRHGPKMPGAIVCDRWREMPAE